MPIITLESVKEVQLGKGKFKEITGKKVGETEEWKTRFFASDKVLADQLHDFEPGDYVNIIMEKKGQYWNVKEFKDVSDEEIEKAIKFSKGPKDAPASASGGSVRRADGGSRGDDTNRASAIYLAREILNNTVKADSYSTDRFIFETIEIADKFIFPYIKDGTVPTMADEPKAKKGKVEKAENPTE